MNLDKKDSDEISELIICEIDACNQNRWMCHAKMNFESCLITYYYCNSLSVKIEL